MLALLSAITGHEYDKTEFEKTGERIFNLEKLFNYREGFRRADDRLPDRFFEDVFTVGPKKGAVLDRCQFDAMLTQYYKDRGWDQAWESKVAGARAGFDLIRGGKKMNAKTLMISFALLAAVDAVAGQSLAADAPKPAQTGEQNTTVGRRWWGLLASHVP